jgi:5'-nucleotidase
MNTAAEAAALHPTVVCAVMLTLSSPVLEFKITKTPNTITVSPTCRMCAAQGLSFDLVASGINRGDNCGLHVIYSGTVGAAREAACKVRQGASLALLLLSLRT